MKVLLIKDVYKLGRAGDVKKVADGYGRNFLIPQGMAVLATPGAMQTAERIRQKATDRRTLLNDEMSVVAEALKKIRFLSVPVPEKQASSMARSPRKRWWMLSIRNPVSPSGASNWICSPFVPWASISSVSA